MPAASIKQVYAHYDRIKSPPEEEYEFCPRCKNRLEMKDMGHHNRLCCKKCGFVYYKNPVPSISILIVEGSHVLLGKRAEEPGLGKWAVPSGYIEYEDDFLSAAIKEAKEETGLDIEIQGIINIVSSFLPGRHYLNIDLLAQPLGGEVHVGDDLLALDWFDPTEPLPDMAFPEDIDMIQMYLAQNTKSLPVDPDYSWAEIES